MKKNALFEKSLASIDPKISEEVNRNVDKILNMKTGDIIRIHTRELYEIVGREPIDNCNICCIKESCPLMNNQAGLCLEPLKLKYGRLYRCDKVMPEDFPQFDEHLRCVLIDKYDDYSIDFRLLKYDDDGDPYYEWDNSYDDDIVWWMAIPLTPQEE